MIEKQPMSQLEALAANIASVRTKIATAAQRAKRDSSEITLVAVSKTKPLEMVKMAYDLGIRTFGENRVQEALLKIAEFRPADIHWHMIGHLQSNKAGKVVGAFDCVHSVDSLHLARIIDRQAEKLNIHQPVLLQINISGEASKEGVAADEAISVARELVAFPHLDVQGLMTVAPLVEDAEETRPVFRALRLLRDRLRDEIPTCSWQQLSMGMTDDYHIAIEEGATIVRVGRAIFGERVYKGETR